MSNDVIHKNKPRKKQKNPQKKREYSSNGYFLIARKILFTDLARDRFALQVFIHLLGCANYKDGGEFKAGQTPHGARDMAERLGMSITTFRKAIKTLEKNQTVKTTSKTRGRARGTTATILNYKTYQEPKAYKLESNCGSLSDPQNPKPKFYGSSSDPQNRVYGSSNDPQTQLCGSPSDPSEYNYKTLQQQQALPHLTAYLKGLKAPVIRKAEVAAAGEFLDQGEVELEKYDLCIRFMLETKKTLDGHKVHRPCAYLNTHFEAILNLAEIRYAVNNFASLQNDEKETESTLEELEAQLREAEIKNPHLAGVLRKLVEARRVAQL